MYIHLILVICFFNFTKSKSLKNLDDKYELIVVGGGLAGLTAAFESYIKSNNSIKILIIEQLKNLGGNSKRATSGINYLQSEPQKLNKIEDNYTLFYNDTMKSGKNTNNPRLVEVFAKGKKSLYNFYKINFGIDTNLISQLGGHSVARTHRPTDSKFVIGHYLITKISEKIKNINNIKILYNSTVTKLLKSEKNNKIYGLKYKNNLEIKENIIYCDAIILSSGGFGHDFGEKGLLKEFVPNIMNFPSTNGPQSKGLGIKLAREIGANLVDMDKVQVHPTWFVDQKNRYNKDKFLAPELLRGVGGILINENGERFCNELGTRDYVTNKIKENCYKQNTNKIEQYECFLLMNEEMEKEFGKNFYYYKNVKGFILEHENFYELSKNLSINYTKLNITINLYNNAFDKKIDEFNKTVFSYKFNLNKKIYSMIVTPSIHYTMGGIKINEKGEVLNFLDEPIYGLYAAGEVTGGVHGKNRLGGNSLAECGVFGRISADSAVNYILKNNNKNNNGKKEFRIALIFEILIVVLILFIYFITRKGYENNNLGNYYLL